MTLAINSLELNGFFKQSSAPISSQKIQSASSSTSENIIKGESYKDTYFFATKLGNHSINGHYLQYLDQLKKFICYFQDNVNTHRSLKLGYELKINLDNASGGYLIQTPKTLETTKVAIYNVNPNRVYIPGCNTYITQREMSYLHWIAQDKTGEEIAKILLITPRTVKAHIKNKFGCNNQFQLGMIYAEIKSLLAV